MPMLDWGTALVLNVERGRTVRVRGFVTKLGEEPHLYIVGIVK
jgi:hypothetical protein